jgi:ATP-dependent DNA helicase RecG
MISLIPKESLKRLQLYFGTKFQTFNQSEVQALITADVEGYVDNARMRQITGHHAADVTRVLQGLVAKYALVQEGQARGSRYRLPLEQRSTNQPLNSIHNGPDSVHNGPDSVHNGSDSLHNSSDSLHNGPDSVHNSPDSVHNSLDSVHNSLDSVHNESISIIKDLSTQQVIQLSKIANRAKNKQRLIPNEMEQIILELCNDRWLSRKQLAELLSRNAEGLRARFLTPMVEHNLLCLRYPDKPNRADQAYTSNKNKF